MTDESHQIPEDMAANYGRLINEAEDMRQAATETLKSVYSDLRDDLKALGWNGASVSFEVAALKGAISEMRLAEKDKTKREVRGERIDDYVSLLTRARARESRETSYAEAKGRKVTDINPRLAKHIVDGMQTEAGRAALITAVDIMIDREEAEQNTPSDALPASVSTVSPPSDSDEEVSDGLLQNSQTDAAISRPGKPRPEIENRSGEEASETEASGEVQDESAIHLPTNSNSQSAADAATSIDADVRDVQGGIPVGANASLSGVTGGESAAIISPEEAEEMARYTTRGNGISPAPVALAPAIGGDHVTADGILNPEAGSGFVNISRACKPLLRPHCQDRALCRSGTSDHCHLCKVAMREGAAS